MHKWSVGICRVRVRCFIEFCRLAKRVKLPILSGIHGNFENLFFFRTSTVRLFSKLYFYTSFLTYTATSKICSFFRTSIVRLFSKLYFNFSFRTLLFGLGHSWVKKPERTNIHFWIKYEIKTTQNHKKTQHKLINIGKFIFKFYSVKPNMS